MEEQICSTHGCTGVPVHHVFVSTTLRGLNEWIITRYCEDHFTATQRLFRKMEASGHAAIDTARPPAAWPIEPLTL